MTKCLVLIAALLAASSSYSADKSAKREPSSTLTREEVNFTFKTKDVDGGQVVCGFASVDGWMSTDATAAPSTPPAASVSCVFVPAKK